MLDAAVMMSSVCFRGFRRAICSGLLRVVACALVPIWFLAACAQSTTTPPMLTVLPTLASYPVPAFQPARIQLAVVSPLSDMARHILSVRSQNNVLQIKSWWVDERGPYLYDGPTLQLYTLRLDVFVGEGTTPVQLKALTVGLHLTGMEDAVVSVPVSQVKLVPYAPSGNWAAVPISAGLVAQQVIESSACSLPAMLGIRITSTTSAPVAIDSIVFGSSLVNFNSMTVGSAEGSNPSLGKLPLVVRPGQQLTIWWHEALASPSAQHHVVEVAPLLRIEYAGTVQYVQSGINEVMPCGASIGASRLLW